MTVPLPLPESRTFPVRLLWTGGWDSTFRLCFLLLVEKRPVEPHYVITTGRQSFAAEIRAMARMKQVLLETHGVPADLLLPTRFVDVTDLRPDATTAAQMQALKGVEYIGRQYEHLARYARQLSLDGLELSVHRDDRAFAFLDGEVKRVNGTDGSPIYTLVEKPRNPNLELFRGFQFPLFAMTKLEMEEQARRHGFAPVMELTWFCHKPLPGDIPCGHCRPCGYAIEEGMARRLPWASRLRHYARRIRSKFGL